MDFRIGNEADAAQLFRHSSRTIVGSAARKDRLAAHDSVPEMTSRAPVVDQRSDYEVATS